MLYKKSMGQHILHNKSVLSRIVDKAAIYPTDTVLEIGPGTGNLTMLLLERAKKVIAIEIDDRFITELKKRVENSVHAKKLTIIKGDALKIQFPFFNIMVANIPYKISSPLVSKLIDLGPTFRCAVIMFQKEFAERLHAQVGDKNYSRLSINTQLYTRVNNLITVKRTMFKPPPKVDSAVVRIEPKRPRPEINKNEWDNLLRACFQRKNKTLRGNLKSKPILQELERNHKKHCAIDKVQPFADFKLNFFDFLEQQDYASKRPAKMSIADFKEFMKKLNDNKIYFS